MGSKWVQHMSGQGGQWELIGESTFFYSVRAEQDGLFCVPLPKSEYRLCEPPEHWVDVTNECRVVPEQSGERAGISHSGPNNAVCLIYGGYRFRKVQLRGLDNIMLEQWAFLIEKRED